MDLTRDVWALAQEFEMFPPGERVLCAVSGGMDSMCLLHLALALGAQHGFSVCAAHYDHSLRGAESRRDADFVRAWCAGHGVELLCGQGDVAAAAKRLGQGVEETARQMRYSFLREAAQTLGAGRIATAHNADDNAETVLLHLLRGASLQGLTGIPPRRGELVRPLLTTPRAAIAGYVRAHALPYVEDSTNLDDLYLRNRVRHQLLPLLEEWNAGFVSRLTQALPTLRSDNDYLSAQAAAVCAAARWEGADLTLPAQAIASLPDALAPRCARQLLSQMGAGDTDCSAAHLRALVSLCRTGGPSASVHLPHRVTARRRYDMLVLTRAAPPAELVPFAPVQGLSPIPGTAWALELATAPWPGLEIRARRTGDTVALPGRPEKTLKKLFIDEKLPRWDRPVTPVAADGDGVVAVAGFGPNTAHPKYQHVQIRFIKRGTEEG